MLDPQNIPAVDADELLARYILYSKHVRKNETLRPDAFVPHPYSNLSVTRHRDATESEIWNVGAAIADQRGKTLHGRGDIAASICLQQELRVTPAPVAGNPNHADIANWPADKPAQKIIAQELAAAASFSRPSC